ncbi:hypothetical protein Q0M94_20895 (plasmid) [Deinococcus radiomollis]|uniref:hypothetical protein n=1 Tax=Deinococcus radiomollis TaxID=468916 RepID=UPI003892C03C
MQRLRDLAFRQPQTVVQVLRCRNQALPQPVGRRALLAAAKIGMFASNILPTRRAPRVG